MEMKKAPKKYHDLAKKEGTIEDFALWYSTMLEDLIPKNLDLWKDGELLYRSADYKITREKSKDLDPTILGVDYWYNAILSVFPQQPIKFERRRTK